MSVNITGDADAAMSKHFHNSPQRNPLSQENRRAGVPKIMKPHTGKRRSFQCCMVVPQYITRFQRRPHWSRKYKAGFMPLVSHLDAFFELLHSMGLENGQKDIWDLERAAGFFRFHFDQLKF